MKKLALLVLMIFFSPLLSANNCVPAASLDKVVFQLSAKRWVTTQTAMLTVNINAALNNADLVKTRNDIMDSLAKIAKGDWHLTQFNRSQDSSGLEKLFVEAQARIAQSSLSDIYQHAKNVSKPGATYTINGIEFKPSLEEIEQARSALRASLYQQANDEIVRLNKVYTAQNYTLNRLDVLDGTPVPPVPLQARQMNTLVMAAAMPAPALTVSNEITMNVLVEAASNRFRSNAGANSQ